MATGAVLLFWIRDRPPARFILTDAERIAVNRVVQGGFFFQVWPLVSAMFHVKHGRSRTALSSRRRRKAGIDASGHQPPEDSSREISKQNL